MSSTALYPVFYRPKKSRVVGGVAAGLAVQLKTNPLFVRLALLFSAFFGGAGLWFYMLLWIFTKPANPIQDEEAVKTLEMATAQASASKKLPQFSRAANLSLVALGIVGAFLSIALVTGFRGANLLSVVVVGVGALLLWRVYDQGIDALTAPRSIVGIVAGTVLVLSGIMFITVNWTSPAMFGATLAAVLLTLAGAALLAVPLVVRMWQRINEEREEKAVAAERADIASRLHDSVLQTLALIQKRAEDPAEVARLARGQERELRQWLFGTQDNMSGGAATVFKAIELACGEVEDMFSVRIAPVLVGSDCALNDISQAGILAAREAMVNAAKHSGQTTVDVYAEAFGDTLDIFVRDRGVGFDPAKVDPSRHGLTDSIRARVERAGGTVSIKTAPGEGVEVHLSLPLDSEA
ncbi:ATP-binding protein [Corynebacterium epidermidicanis]|uniref:Phage shock protein C (PspC) family protein n=1 Tax=Corynebacterium epidermidicanis TaxID=1050174 RepID=A0A0G3GML4_9CORY|nr:ATP-binding protein [Corynebacterium epidermidicanis]AKK02384.1 phage shock protein C (PspC) family protein [Corynebacterium epidermidicanis]